jgi:hypothetical protein
MSGLQNQFAAWQKAGRDKFKYQQQVCDGLKEEIKCLQKKHHSCTLCDLECGKHVNPGIFWKFKEGWLLLIDHSSLNTLHVCNYFVLYSGFLFMTIQGRLQHHHPVPLRFLVLLCSLILQTMLGNNAVFHVPFNFPKAMPGLDISVSEAFAKCKVAIIT